MWLLLLYYYILPKILHHPMQLAHVGWDPYGSPSKEFKYFIGLYPSYRGIGNILCIFCHYALDFHDASSWMCPKSDMSVLCYIFVTSLWVSLLIFLHEDKNIDKFYKKIIWLSSSRRCVLQLGFCMPYRSFRGWMNGSFACLEAGTTQVQHM